MKHRLLIVGAGPVGLTLAVELARYGIPFQLIDKASGPAPQNESRALAFNLRSQDILQASGVTKELHKIGSPLNQVRFKWKENLLKEVDLHLPNHPERKLFAIRQGAIERVLIKNLSDQGISPQWNTELAGITNKNDNIQAHIIGTNGKEEKSDFDYILSCEGAHSIVRKQGGYSYDGKTIPAVWSLADIIVDTNKFDHQITADMFPGGANATIPIEPNCVRIMRTGDNVLGEHPNMKHHVETIWQSEFRVSYRMVKKFSRGRTFLCGDAAHIHSPLGGRGMNLGIEDAATLAFLLSKNRESEYSDIRLPVAKKVIATTHQQTKLIQTNSLISTFTKRFIIPLAFSFPPVRNNLLNGLHALDTPTPEWLINS